MNPAATSNARATHGVDGIYSIKRHGTTIDDCDREPVQTPGCVQAHGALLALRADDLTVAQASENLAEFVGVAADDALNRSIDELCGRTLGTRIRALLEGGTTERNPAFLATLPAEPPRRPRPLDAIVHTIGDTVLLELEPTSPEAERSDSYASVKRAIGRLKRAGTLAEFCETAAEEVRAMTGLDRVMIYRFLPDDSGEVIAESRGDGLESWLGLRYPAHDIPAPAREIFKRIWIRPLPDARGPLVEMRPLAHPDTGRPLEMTHCALRGASVMYTEYLQNMRVAATLTMSILKGPRLWGLIACHHYTPTSFPHRMRVACEFLAQFVSMHLDGAQEREHLQYLMRIDAVHHAAVSRAATSGRLASMMDGAPSILTGIDADGFALYHDGAWSTLGDTPTPAALEAFLPWVRGQLAVSGEETYATDALAQVCPIAGEQGIRSCGVLATTPARSASALAVWFRNEELQSVRWAGNPHEMPLVVGPNGPRLTPRRSFELYQEQVRGRSRPWLDVEVDAARRMRGLVGDLVIVRAEQIAEMNVELARSNEALDAFAYVASHDLKEPLRGINRYATKLLDEVKTTGGKVGEQGPERLEAMLRLTTRMDGLINSLLHYSRVGRAQLDLVVQDVDEVLEEAIDIVLPRMRERDVKLVRPRRLPTLACDGVRVREVFANLISNAIKYNDKSHPTVEVGHILPGERVPATILDATLPPAADGNIVFYVADNGIGIDPQYHVRVFELFKRLHGRDDFGGGSGAGLTIVRRLVEQHGGAIWLSSKPDVGTTFLFTLAPQRAR